MAAVKRKTKWNPSLHPRDARGRFTKSSTRVMKGSDTTRARSALNGFAPAKVATQGDARAWMERKSSGRARPAPDSAMGQFLAGGWRTTNPAIRSQKTPPPEVPDIDAEFSELDEDVMLRRQVPLKMFAHIPIKDLEGMKVRDAAYGSAMLDTPDAGPSAPDAVTMHIAAPAGTSVFINAADGEFVMARDTEVAVTRAEPNGRGGWDLYGVIIPKTATKRDRPADRQGDEASPALSGASGPDSAPATGGNRDAGGGDGGRGSAEGSPRAAAAQTDAPARRGGSTGGRGQRAAGDGGQATGDETPAAGTSAPDEEDEPAELPDDGPLGAMTPLDRERIRVAVENQAARIYSSPMVGGSKDEVVRYVADSDPLDRLHDQYGRPAVWEAVRQIVTDRPELMTRSPEESDRAAVERTERVESMASEAADLTKAGDYDGALDLLDQAERIAPDHLTKGSRSWDTLRGIVRRRQEKDRPAENGGDDNTAPDAGTTDGTPAPGPDSDGGDLVDVEQDRQWIAPDTGALAELSPIDRERVRVAVENNAARVFRTPFMGGTAGNTARYVAEGRDLRDIADRYGFRQTVNAVSQILNDRPELMRRTDDEMAAAVEARNADIAARVAAVDAALVRGDLAAARAEINQGEAIDPSYTMDEPGMPPLGWDGMRRIVDSVEEERRGGETGEPATVPDAGDATPAAGTPAPDATEPDTPAPAAPPAPDAVTPGQPRTVAELSRNDHVSVTGRRPGRDDDRTATGYVAAVTPTGDGDTQMVTLAQYPDGAGPRELVLTGPGDPVDVATPADNVEVVLWRDARTGRVIPNPGQTNIVRGDVVRDTAREDAVRATLAELAARRTGGQPDAGGTPPAAGPDTPDTDTADVPAVPEGLHGITPDGGWTGQRTPGTGPGTRQNQRTEGPTRRQAEELAERRRQALEDARKWEDAGNTTRAADLDAHAMDIETDLRNYGFDPDTGRPERQKRTKTGGRRPAAGTSASSRDPGEEHRRKDYERGWNASRRGGNLDAADYRGEPDVWYAGYGDHATGRAKWTSLPTQVTPGQAQDAAAKLGPEETETIVGPDGISGADREQLADLVAAAAALPDSDPDGPDTGGTTPTPSPAPAPALVGAAQGDIFGGTTEFVSAPRSAIGLADRPNVGRERAIAAVQQLGMFDISDQRQTADQMALLDSLLDMPAPDPTVPAPPAPEVAAPATPDAPESIVPLDLSDWNDEQLAETFRVVTGVHDLDQVDEDAAQRIMDEWDRREAGMANLVASVPDDLAALPEDEVMGLYARLTGELGTLDHPTVERLGAELDRRQEEERLAAENAPKRAMLDRPVSELTDDEIDVTLGYASDLDDIPALERLIIELGRREEDREAAAEQERRDLEARQAAEREAVLQAAQEAERRAAAEHAEAQRQRLVDAMAAAQDALFVPPYSNEAIHQAVSTLGEEGLRAVLGNDTVDRWFEGVDDNGRWSALRTGAVALPTSDRVRLVFEVADQQNEEEFRDLENWDLQVENSRGYSSENPEERDRAVRAGRELTRRKVQKFRDAYSREYRQWQARALTTPPEQLSDMELEAAPVMVTAAGRDTDVPARLDALRSEVLRRQAESASIAEAKANGPDRPARYRNPVEAYGQLRLLLGNGHYRRDSEAKDRLRRAQATVYGLPEDADDKVIRAAARADPRPVADQAAAVMAWHRHLAQYEDVGNTPRREWVGYPDDPDVPDTPDPAPAAKVSKPDEVWKQILTFAMQERTQGRHEDARRALLAITRTYRIPAFDIPANDGGIQTLQGLIGPALRYDERTERQRAADFIAQYRVLAVEEGIDPSDTLRHGPPDTGSSKPQSVWRKSTPEQERRIDALVAQGWDWIDAYARVHGTTADALRDADQQQTRIPEAQIRDAYGEWLELQFKQAEAATNGYLLKRTSVGKMDARRLFSGAWRTARAHASEELLRWWGENPRLTYADFKTQLLGGGGVRAGIAAAAEGNEFA